MNFKNDLQFLQFENPMKDMQLLPAKNKKSEGIITRYFFLKREPATHIYIHYVSQEVSPTIAHLF